MNSIKHQNTIPPNFGVQALPILPEGVNCGLFSTNTSSWFLVLSFQFLYSEARDKWQPRQFIVSGSEFQVSEKVVAKLYWAYSL